jgi:hypothetical protein
VARSSKRGNPALSFRRARPIGVATVNITPRLGGCPQPER